MTSGTKSTIDMALGTATCASFAIPEGGALIGGGIAAGQFVFDVFYPSDDHTDPAELTPTKADIDRSTATVVSAISDAAFTAHRDNVATFASDFHDVWKRMQARPDGLSPVTWASLAAHLKTQCERYFNDAKGTDELKSALRWIESQNCPNSMVSVYLLAASLLIAYHKTGLNWEINEIAERYRADRDVYDTFVQQHLAGQNEPNNPPGPPPPAGGEPAMPETSEMIAASFHAGTLRDDVLPDLIAKATTIHDGWQSRWASRKKQLDAAHQQALKQNAALDPVQQQLKWGGEFAYHYDTLTTQLNLTGVTSEEDIKKVGQTIDKWKSIQASLCAPQK